MDIYIYVVILCVSGLLNLHLVFGKIDSSVSILNDIRNELNTLKISNERNERKILRLEQQVNGCHTKYEELAKQIPSVAPIVQRLADIEHKVEASQQELVKRLTSIEMSRGTEKENDNNDKCGTPEEDEQLEVNLDTVEEGNAPELTASRVTSRPITNTKIAFAAYMSVPWAQGLGYEQIIPFNSVQTNVGQAFNPASHEFICPVSGMYYFASSLMALQHQYSMTEMVKDGSILTEMYADSDSDISQRGFDQGFNSVVTICNKGETVWVRIFKHEGTSVFGGKFSTFTGFLLWEL